MLKKLFGDLFGKVLAEESPAPTLEQRRKTVRRPCDFEVEGWLGKRAFVARVIDLGVGGMRLCLEEPMALKQQTVVSVTYPEPLRNCESLTVDAHARWTRTRPSDGAQIIGLEFKDPKTMGKSWVKVKMHELGFASYNIREQRKEVRVSCGLKATVQIAGEAVPCLVKNLGRGGAYVELMKPLRAGASVNLRMLESAELPSANLEVTVRHQQHSDPSDPFGFGLAFGTLEGSFQQALEAFLLKQQSALFQTGHAKVSSDGFFSEDDVVDGSTEEVEVPDLKTILEETEEASKD